MEYDREEPPREPFLGVLTPRARFIIGRYPTLPERQEVFEERGMHVTGSEVWLLMKGSDKHLKNLIREEERLNRGPHILGRMLQFLHAGASRG